MKNMFLIPAETGNLNIPTQESQYEAYKYQWLASQGASLMEVFAEVQIYQTSSDENLKKPLLQLFKEWEEKVGIKGKTYLNYGAWLAETGGTFYAIMEETGWVVISKSQGEDKAIVWYTLQYTYLSPYNYTITVRKGHEGDDFVKAMEYFNSDEWVKNYILQNKARKNDFTVAELMDYAFQIQCKLTQTFNELRNAGLI